MQVIAMARDGRIHADTTAFPLPSGGRRVCRLRQGHIAGRACSVGSFTGTMKGPMKGPDGKEIPPTGTSFEVDFCTVARWENGQIVEEKLFTISSA
jgi:hypothetical protein